VISYTLNGAQLVQLWQYYARDAPVIKHVVRLAMWTRAAVIEQQPQDNIAQDEFLGVRGSAKQCIRRHVNDQRGEGDGLVRQREPRERGDAIYRTHRAVSEILRHLALSL